MATRLELNPYVLFIDTFLDCIYIEAGICDEVNKRVARHILGDYLASIYEEVSKGITPEEFKIIKNIGFDEKRVIYYDLLDGIVKDLSTRLVNLIEELRAFEKIEIERTTLKELSHILENSFKNKIKEIFKKLTKFEEESNEVMKKSKANFSAV